MREMEASRITDAIKEMCIEAVKNNGNALQWIPNELRDKEMCITAVENDDSALEFVPNELHELCVERIDEMYDERQWYLNLEKERRWKEAYAYED